MMKRLFALLFVLVCLPALAGSPYIINVGGAGTNSMLLTPTMSGRVAVTNAPYTGGTDTPFYLNGGTGPSITTWFGDIYGDNLTFLGGVAGFGWYDKAHTGPRMSLGMDFRTAGYEDGILRMYRGLQVGSQVGPTVYGDIMSGNPGVLESAYIPFIGGSIAGASGGTTHGGEIAQRMPQMMIALYSPVTSEAWVTSNIAGGIASGIVGAWQAAGAQMTVGLEPGWAKNTRDENNDLQWNTNSYPDGPVLFIYKCHTNGFKVSLHQYVETRSTNLYQVTYNGFPSSTDPLLVPATTGNYVTRDVKRFYDWGVDTFRAVNLENQTIGHQQMQMRLIAEEVLYPRGYDYTTLGYTNPMSMANQIGSGGLAIPASAAYDSTLSYGDQGFGAGTGVARAIDRARITWTNRAWMIGKGHFHGVCAPNDGLSNTDPAGPWLNLSHCQADLAFAALFPGQLWQLPGFTNSWYSTYAGTLTNRVMLDCMFDPGYYPGFSVRDSGSSGSSVWLKPLARGGYELVMANQSGGTLNMSFNWSTNVCSPASFFPVHCPGVYPFCLMSNTAWTVTDAFNGTNQLCIGGNFTASVTNNGVMMFKLSPAAVLVNETLVTPTSSGIQTFTKAAFSADGTGTPIYVGNASGPGLSSYYGDILGDNLFLKGGTSGIWIADKFNKILATIGSGQDVGLPNNILSLFYADRVNGNPNFDGDIMAGRLGAVQSAHIPFLGGSIGFANSVPIHNDEMAQRVPKMMIYLYGTPTTQNYLTSNITGGIASGIIPTLQSFGAQFAVDCEPGWQQDLRDSTGHLQWATNRFPDGPVLFCRKMHTNGVQVILHQYVETIVTNDSFYTFDANQPDASHNCPATTMDKVTKDVSTGYSWGIDAFRWADNNSSQTYTTAYQEGVMRVFNDEVLHPHGVHYSYLTEVLGYTNPMHTEFFLGHGTVELIPPSTAYECPVYFNDQSQGAGSSGDFTRAIDQMRVTWTNQAWMLGKGHFVGQTAVGSLVSDSDPTTMWATMKSAQASLAATVIFPMYWLFPGFTNAWWSTYASTVTNATMCRMAFDPAYLPGFPVWDTGVGGTSCWIKPLDNGDYALMMANETGGDLNLTLNWSTNLHSPTSFLPTHAKGVYPVVISSNMVFKVYDAFNATNQLCLSGSFTAVIPSGGSSLFRLVKEEWPVTPQRLSVQSMFFYTNSTTMTVTVNTNAATGLNFGGTAVLNPGWTDITVTNNQGQVLYREVCGSITFTTGAGTQPTGGTYFTNTVSPAFTTQPEVFVSMNGQGWITSGSIGNLLAGTNAATAPLNPLAAFTVGKASQVLAINTAHTVAFCMKSRN